MTELLVPLCGIKATDTTPVFALVEVNNFYASCEQLRGPKLRNLAVVVPSINDGCMMVITGSLSPIEVTLPTSTPTRWVQA